MSVHPNVILMAVLRPNDLSNETMRNIRADAKADDYGFIKINGREYISKVMENDYDEDYQIAADEGDLVFFDMVTYGYGEVITWEELEKQKIALGLWAKNKSEKFNCYYSICVTANYW